MKTLNAKIEGKPVPQTETELAYFEALESIAVAKMRRAQGDYPGGVRKLMADMRRAKKLHFPNLAFELSNFLYYYYAVIKPNKKRAQEFLEITEEYEIKAIARNKVQRDYIRLIGEMNRSRHFDKALKGELSQFFNDNLKHLSLECTPIHIYIYTLLIKKAYLQSDYKEVINRSNEIISFLEQRDIERTSLFYSYLVPALLATGGDAERAIKKALYGQNRDSYNWSLFMYHYFSLSIRKKDYQKADKIFREADKREQPNEYLTEQWLIAKGYLEFLYRRGLIEREEQFFKLGRLLNEVPKFSKDKRGNNVNIIILQILLRLGKDNGSIIQNMDAIKQYISRYREPTKARTFLKLISRIPKNDFKIKPDWPEVQELRSREKEYCEIGVVPWLDLWELVKEVLG